MALIWMDGFDHYNPNTQYLLKGYVGNAPAQYFSGTTTRFDYGQCINPNGNGNTGLQRLLPNNVSTIYLGMALYWTSGTAAVSCLGFWDTTGNISQVELRCNSIGQYYFTRNGTQIGGFASVSRVAGQWNYIEVSVTFATGTSGSAILRINGQTVLTVTGVNTSASGNAWCNEINWGLSSAWNTYIDDLYICDNTTSQNNGFLGDVRVWSLMPAGAGSSTQWTPTGAADNWECVDTTPVATTDYVSSSTPGQIDLYTIQQIAEATNVSAVQVSYFAEKTDSGTRVIEGVVQSGTVQETGAPNYLGSSYTFYTDRYPTDPNTGAPWTLAGVNAMQIGLEEVS